MRERYQQAFYEGAQAAGLTDDEAHTLHKLCADWPTHTTHAASLAQNRSLAKQADVELTTIGYSLDGNHRIELCAVGNPEPGGINGYIQGPEHASELLGATTTAVLKELMVYHPDIYRRYGYDGMLFCDHIDPAGMAMQQWNRRPQTLRSFVYGGYRGHWHDQVSWSYPTASYYPLEGPAYYDRHPETIASLDILRSYMPYFFGSMHSSTFSSYIVASHNNHAMAQKLSQIMQNYELQFNTDEPESPGIPVLAPGVFGVETQDSYARRLGDATAIEPAPGGTNASEHLRPGALMFVPEISGLEALPNKHWPEYVPRRTAIAYRTEYAQRAIAAAALGLQRMEPWIDRHIGRADVRRLRDAAVFWRDFVGPQLAADLEQANTNTHDDWLITKAKFMQLAGTAVCNALIATSNVYRLARQARDRQTGLLLREAIDPGIASLRPTRVIPIRRQLAVHSLATLIGTRHALDR